MKKRTLLLITWRDTVGGHGWEREDTKFRQGVLTRTVGWKVREGRKAITVAATRNTLGDCVDRETIPWGAIEKIEELG